VERTDAGDDLDVHVERIRVTGFTVVPGGLASDDVVHLGVRIQEVLERQLEEFGTAQMDAIGDALTARAPLVYDDAFLRLAAHPVILAICRRLMGPYIVLMQQNGVINPPSQVHTQLAYHRDLPYQHFVSSRPLAISALFCIDAFRADNGATTVLPGTHRCEAFPSDSVAAQLDTSVYAPAGSFIVFDAMLYHRAGHNHSSDVRRAVNHVYSVPVIAQQISLPAALEGRHADDPELARLLGYDVAPAPSVRAWRERRLRRQRE
jgi:ectoine hydroxylase-related dioxygenase (phytanoyl-CoA dioxygenase family)